MPTLPISCAIITKNEEDRVPLAIEAVKDWVDEVIVIDSGSTDRTIEICRSLDARVIHRDWEGAAPQKHFGQDQCRNDWVLFIDADEVVSSELRDEILAAFGSNHRPAKDAYEFPLLPIYNFQKKYKASTVHRFPIKLYCKSKGGFRNDVDPFYDAVTMNPGTTKARFKGMLRHYSFRSIYDHVDKLNWSTENMAANLVSRGKNPTFFELLTLPALAFFKQFIFRREFLNGIDGVIISHIFAFQRFLRIAKARERFRGGPWGPDAKIGIDMDACAAEVTSARGNDAIPEATPSDN